MNTINSKYLRETEEEWGGVRHRYLFPNGYGASVIRHEYSYGYEDGLWEVAVLGQGGHLTYTTPITDDVIGRLDEAGVNKVLAQIEALPREEATTGGTS